MVIFHGYVSLPEGKQGHIVTWRGNIDMKRFFIQPSQIKPPSDPSSQIVNYWLHGQHANNHHYVVWIQRANHSDQLTIVAILIVCPNFGDLSYLMFHNQQAQQILPSAVEILGI